MLKARNNNRGVILLIVLGTVLVVTVVAATIITLATSQSRLTLHQVSRIKAYYAAKGIMNYALEKLRQGASGGWVPDASVNKYACFTTLGCIDGVTNTYPIPDDPDFPPFKIQVTIHPLNQALTNTVTQIDIKTDYTYTTT